LGVVEAAGVEPRGAGGEVEGVEEVVMVMVVVAMVAV
jgi:hypothetical protein